MYRKWSALIAAPPILVAAAFLLGGRDNAMADYKLLLQRGATQSEVHQLYSVYQSEVLHHTGDRLAEIEQLAGGSAYRHSFMLACLSNGWVVRAVDVDRQFLPPSGAWLFSHQNYAGYVRQFPANCESHDCMDVASLEGFEAKSIDVGSKVRAQLFSKERFDGRAEFVPGKLPVIEIDVRSMRLRTPPRIDYATFSEFSQDDDNASFRLHVSGANVDEGAVVRVDGRDQPNSDLEVRLDNSTWLGLGTDKAEAGYTLDPTYFAFPIFHYDSVVTRLSAIPCGETLEVTVRNPDGQASNSIQVLVPTMETLDSDGDGLLDSWETEGVEGLDLKQLHADPLRKDLYVEVDRMLVQGRMWSDFAERSYPRPRVFEDAETLFRQAPIINPDGSSGIALHVDYGQPQFAASGSGRGGTTIPWTRYINYGPAESHGCNPDGYTDVLALRQDPQYFDTNRRRVFRYCVFADQQPGSRSTGGGRTGATFYVTLGVCRMKAIDHNYQLGVFVHEFGHTLRLSHTGNQNKYFNNKPNFNSLMNYLFTFPGRDIDGKLADVTGTISGDQIYVFSEGMRADLHEDALSEVLGVANHYPHDWNRNGHIDSQPVREILRNRKYTIPEIILDYADWANLDFTVDEK